MMFPFLGNEVENEEQTLPLFKEYEYIFETNKLTGRILEGNEALKIWIYKALNTERYRYNVYTWDYGQELERLIGQGYDVQYIKSEVERYVKDCLMVNPYIKRCHEFIITMTGDDLTVNFKVETVYGGVMINDI